MQNKSSLSLPESMLVVYGIFIRYYSDSATIMVDTTATDLTDPGATHPGTCAMRGSCLPTRASPSKPIAHTPHCHRVPPPPPSPVLPPLGYMAVY